VAKAILAAVVDRGSVIAALDRARLDALRERDASQGKRFAPIGGGNTTAIEE
jgi:hypothetical protein